jgi:outer membrane protein assembly factor BamB
VFAGLGFTACGGATRWWMFQADLRHGGHNPGLSSRLPHTLRWSVPLVTGLVQLTPPVFGKGKILIGSSAGDGKLYALSPGNGSTLWSFTAPAGNGFEGAAAAVGGRVFAATSGPSPHAYALDEATGAVVWQTPLAAQNHASIAVAAGRVFVNTDHELYALAASTGALVWTAATSPGTGASSAPAVESGRVFVGSHDGLFAFNPASTSAASSALRRRMSSGSA